MGREVSAFLERPEGKVESRSIGVTRNVDPSRERSLQMEQKPGRPLEGDSHEWPLKHGGASRLFRTAEADEPARNSPKIAESEAGCFGSPEAQREGQHRKCDDDQLVVGYGPVGD